MLFEEFILLFKDTYNDIFSRRLKFIIIVFIVLLTLFFIRGFRISEYSDVIILFVFIIIICSEFVKWYSLDKDNYLDSTYKKLETLQSTMDTYLQNEYIQRTKELFKNNAQDFSGSNTVNSIHFNLSNMYIDADLINFVYSIHKEYMTYNAKTFVKFVKGVNNILGLKRELQLLEDSTLSNNNIAEMLQTAMRLKTNTLNNLHSFIYVFPKNDAYRNLMRPTIIKYNKLITRVLDYIHSRYLTTVNGNTKYTTQTKFVTYGQFPKEHNSDIFKPNNIIHNEFY